MPEMRYNLITGEWVIVATDRAGRPLDHAHTRARQSAPPHSAACPFCPGNEDQTGQETLRLPEQGPWHLRVVPNRYPALAPEGQAVRTGERYNMSLAGVGRHEVIIESERHDLSLGRLGPEGVERVLRAYGQRMEAFYELPQVEHVIVFENHGEAAGSSLIHPHSQIVGIPVVSGQVRQRIQHGLNFFGDNGECVYCHCLRKELADGRRIIEQNDDFVAFVPFASLSPFHLWIFPRSHGAYFGDLVPAGRRSLAGLLGSVLRRIDRGLDDPDYNLVVRSLGPSERELKYFHWYLSIVPRVSSVAGFELGTGIYVNTQSPEAAAERLRAADPDGD